MCLYTQPSVMTTYHVPKGTQRALGSPRVQGAHKCKLMVLEAAMGARPSILEKDDWRGCWHKGHGLMRLVLFIVCMVVQR